MNGYALLFWLFFAIAVGGGFFILFSRNIIYAAFMLMIVFLALAGIYIIARAEFVAITQILIYVGGILILLVFGVMLTNRIEGNTVITRQGSRLWAGIIAIIIMAVLYHVFIRSVEWGELFTENINGALNTQRIGMQLMTSKVLILEMAGLLLLIALIGSAFMARREFDEAEK